MRIECIKVDKNYSQLSRAREIPIFVLVPKLFKHNSTVYYLKSDANELAPILNSGESTNTW